LENIPNNEIENWAKVQSDRFQNMVIRGFHTELEAVYEEKNISMASDNDKEFAALWKLLTPTHPYGTQTTIGEQEHLKNPSIINIQNYFHRYYVPNNVAICLAGDFDPDQTIAIIDKYFGSWKKSATTSRDVRNLVSQAELVDASYRVATTDE
jgi:predicted Zn-dependent peptidase